jgi:hypothetical protein
MTAGRGTQLRKVVGLASIAFGGLTLPPEVFAQSQTLTGTVHDSRGAPLQYAVVSLRGLNREARTDSVGVFKFVELKAGDLVLDVRRLGYQPRIVALVIPLANSTPLRVILEEGVVKLATVEVSEQNKRVKKYMEAFERRRRSGSGQFVTRGELIARNPTRLSDALRDLPGIQISRVGVRGTTLRFTSSASIRRDCVPQYWVDGQLARGADVDDFPPGDVEGIELYSGPATTPMQFSPLGPSLTCGAVVIWTRPPG